MTTLEPWMFEGLPVEKVDGQFAFRSAFVNYPIPFTTICGLPQQKREVVNIYNSLLWERFETQRNLHSDCFLNADQIGLTERAQKMKQIDNQLAAWRAWGKGE